MLRKIDYLYLLILSVVTIYTWFPLTALILQWESYTYMTTRFYLPLYTNTWHSFANFDVQSMLVGSILSKLVGLNMPMYFWVEILTLVVINICVYLLVKTLTKSSLPAFAAAFIFGLYFFGPEFFAPNYYATFVQRVILNVPLLLMSFLFLHRFLTENKVQYYVASLSLFIVSIFLAHFGILFAFHFFFYPIYWHLVSSPRFRSFLRGVFICLPYVLILVFFWQLQRTYGEVLEPNESFFYFLTHPAAYHYIEGTIRQLVYMSQYITVIKALLSGLSPFVYVDPISTYKYVSLILVIYSINFVIIWLKDKNHRALLLTIVSALMVSLIINIYLDRFDFLSGAGLNRYYYYPSFLLAIFWALVLTSLSKGKRKFFVGIVLFGYFLVSTALFKQYFYDLGQMAFPTVKIYQYLMSNFEKFPERSLVIIGPTPIFGPYETTFFTEQLGTKRGIEFCTADPVYPKCRELEPQSKHIIQLLFDKTCGCVQQTILR